MKSFLGLIIFTLICLQVLGQKKTSLSPDPYTLLAKVLKYSHKLYFHGACKVGHASGDAEFDFTHLSKLFPNIIVSYSAFGNSAREGGTLRNFRYTKGGFNNTKILLADWVNFNKNRSTDTFQLSLLDDSLSYKLYIGINGQSYTYYINVELGQQEFKEISNLLTSEEFPLVTELNAEIVSTVASGIKRGLEDGQGNSATFWNNNDRKIAIDKNGNIYVTDSFKIRKITKDGLVTTFAGNDWYGSNDGQGKVASFYGISDLTTDDQGNIYALDKSDSSRHWVIRKITSTGYVNTLTGSYGERGKIAVDSIGNMYITVQTNKIILKITPSGEITTFAGNNELEQKDGIGIKATFNNITDLKINNHGDIILLDHDKHYLFNSIRKISSSGEVNTICKIPAKDYRNIAIDTLQNIYIPDGFSSILKINSRGEINTFAGSGKVGLKDGKGADAFFDHPNYIAIDQTGNLYITDNNPVIRKISPTGDVTTFAGGGKPIASNYPWSLTLISNPLGLAIDNKKNIYYIDNFNCVKKISSEGVLSILAGNVEDSTRNAHDKVNIFNKPSSIAIDNYGNLYVPDNGDNIIKKITPSGVVSIFSGSGIKGSKDGNAKEATFNDICCIAVDISGFVYVLEIDKGHIRKINPNGYVSTLVGGDILLKYSKNGGCNFCPNFGGIAVDIKKNLYVSNDNNQILKIDATGKVVKFAGSGESGSQNGQKSLASFNIPKGLVVDKLGNIFISDSSNGQIRIIEPSGNVRTLVGKIPNGTQDGKATVASFMEPNCLTIDCNGNIYLTDNNLIRKITTSNSVSKKLLN